MQLAKRVDMVPITRDYMFVWERHGRLPTRPRTAHSGVTLNRT
jgi:hypothetical protein